MRKRPAADLPEPRENPEQFRNRVRMVYAQIRQRPAVNVLATPMTAAEISLYDAIEVQALNYDGTDYNQVEDIIEANTFAVYWHLAAGGVECIGDAATYSDAMAFAEALSAATGYPVNDMTP